MKFFKDKGQEVLTNSKDVIGICEETDTCNDASTDMIPPKWSLVNLCKCKTTAFVDIGYVTEIVVEVMECVVSLSYLQ